MRDASGMVSFNPCFRGSSLDARQQALSQAKGRFQSLIVELALDAGLLGEEGHFDGFILVFLDLLLIEAVCA